MDDHAGQDTSDPVRQGAGRPGPPHAGAGSPGEGPTPDPPTLQTHSSYLAALSMRKPKPFNAWRAAVLATLVGVAVTLTLGLVLVVVAFFLLVGLVSRGLVNDGWSPQLVFFGPPVAVLVVAVCIGLACEAWFLKRRGVARPLIATLTSVAATWTVAMLGALIELTSLPLVMAGAATHVTVLAKTIKPESPAAL